MLKNTSGPATGIMLVMFAVSAAMLAFEILLVRLFEFSHWHHFAGLAVSLALLGLGAAGTWLALRCGAAGDRVDRILVQGAFIQSAGILVVLYLHSAIAVRPLFAAWDGTELARLLLIDFAAFIPFFGAGLVIGSVFSCWPDNARSIYAANLLGSAAGSLLASAALAVMQVETALALTALTPALAIMACLSGRMTLKFRAATVLLLAAGLFCLLRPPELRVSDFKALSRILDLPDVRVLDVQSGLPGRLTVLRSDSLRFAPGLSLQWAEPVPAADAAIVGSDRLIPVPRVFSGVTAHTAASLSGLPIILRPSGRVLVLGASAWQSQLAAAGREMIWVESDGRLLELARRKGLSGAASQLVPDSAYRFLAASNRTFTLIALDTAYKGGDAASEDYLMTVEGLALALGRLALDGLLVLPLRYSVPPRQVHRALSTLHKALLRHGIAQPVQHVAVLRGLQDLVILASPRPLQSGDIRVIREFAQHWRFDLAWLPGIDEAETNRFHRLDTPVFYLSAKALFQGGELPSEARWFTVDPSTQARPYFWRSLDWGRVPELVRNLGRQRAASYLDWPLLLTAASAVGVSLLALGLIVLPLGRLPPVGRPYSRTSLALYFTALGLGYLLLELLFFQRSLQFLGEPVVAAAVVFAVFLAGSGIGSMSAPRFVDARSVKQVFLPIAAGLVPGLVFFWLWPGVLLHPQLPARIILIAAVLAPLAWALGRPFPWALRQLSGQNRWVPWAWGINGFASVLAASLATLISVHRGHVFTLAAALVCYIVAALIARRWIKRR